ARPDRFDLFLFAVEPERVDFLRARESADQDRDVVFLSLCVVNILEKKRAPFFFVEAAELPADERMHLGVFVDRPRDAVKQTGAVERGDVFLKVAIIGHVASSFGCALLTMRAEKSEAGAGKNGRSLEPVHFSYDRHLYHELYSMINAVGTAKCRCIFSPPGRTGRGRCARPSETSRATRTAARRKKSRGCCCDRARPFSPAACAGRAASTSSRRSSRCRSRDRRGSSSPRALP